MHQGEVMLFPVHVAPKIEELDDSVAFDISAPVIGGIKGYRACVDGGDKLRDTSRAKPVRRYEYVVHVADYG